VGALAQMKSSVRLVSHDQLGKKLEWIVKPTGSRSFELTIPEGMEVGDPRAWESISIMTQKSVVSRADCGGQCQNQCGCQGNNCGSQGSFVSEIMLKPKGIDSARPQ